MDKRAHIFYSGYVQGVGFRYTARRVALRNGVVGWVKNLADGRVEFMAEGSEKDLNMTLDSIQQTFSSCIRDADIRWSDATGEFDAFDIKF